MWKSYDPCGVWFVELPQPIAGWKCRALRDRTLDLLPAYHVEGRAGYALVDTDDSGEIIACWWSPGGPDWSILEDGGVYKMDEFESIVGEALGAGCVVPKCREFRALA